MSEAYSEACKSLFEKAKQDPSFWDEYQKIVLEELRLQDAEIGRGKATIESKDEYIKDKKAENALLKEQLKAAILNLARVAIEGGDET
jgi:hypothetical protein